MYVIKFAVMWAMQPHELSSCIQAVQSSMAEGAIALASMQRMVEERTQQATSAQQALMQLQQEQANLTARLHTAQDQAALRYFVFCRLIKSRLWSVKD